MAASILLCAEAGLRAALAEQFAPGAQAAAEAHACGEVPAEIPDDVVLIVLDADLLDKKTARRLAEWQSVSGKKIFLLGESGEAETLAAEIFQKPLRLGHLLARAQFHMRAARMQGAPVNFGIFRFEPASRQAVNVASGEVLRLTEKESDLLEYLGRAGSSVPREELLAAVWGYDGRIDTHTLETHIYRLRRKLDPTNSGESLIIAQDGAYRLAEPA